MIELLMSLSLATVIIDTPQNYQECLMIAGQMRAERLANGMPNDVAEAMYRKDVANCKKDFPQRYSSNSLTPLPGCIVVGTPPKQLVFCGE